MYGIKENKCLDRLNIVEYIELGVYKKNEQGVFYIKVDKEKVDLSKNLVLYGMEMEETVATEKLSYRLLPVEQVYCNTVRDEQSITLKGTYATGVTQGAVIWLAVIPSDIPL